MILLPKLTAVKLGGAGLACALLAGCSSLGFGDALFSGMCVASQASCLQSCRADYRETGGAYSYDSCRMQCQPGGNSCD